MMKKRKMQGTLPPGGTCGGGTSRGKSRLYEATAYFKQRLVDLQGKCLPSKHKDLRLDSQHASAKPGLRPIISVLKAGGGRHR